jgi:hypothetical protein
LFTAGERRIILIVIRRLEFILFLTGTMISPGAFGGFTY